MLLATTVQYMLCSFDNLLHFLDKYALKRGSSSRAIVITLWKKESIISFNIAAKNISLIVLFQKCFLLKEVVDSAMSHSQLPPNSAPEPHFDRRGTPTSVTTTTFLEINDGEFETGIPFVAF
jgi:hypothetical protein